MLCCQHNADHCPISSLLPPFNDSLKCGELYSWMQARRDTVIADIKWFYRVTELPEAVYLLLMEDRKKGCCCFFLRQTRTPKLKSLSPTDEVFSNPKAKERELFMAFNPDTHPASLLRYLPPLSPLPHLPFPLFLSFLHTFLDFKPFSLCLNLPSVAKHNCVSIHHPPSQPPYQGGNPLSCSLLTSPLKLAITTHVKCTLSIVLVFKLVHPLRPAKQCC